MVHFSEYGVTRQVDCCRLTPPLRFMPSDWRLKPSSSLKSVRQKGPAKSPTEESVGLCKSNREDHNHYYDAYGHPNPNLCAP